uniref:E3 ubiquitin-protein ligase XIAP n=1 Tax=Cacopsylla melanoneura TaxID=428564 RepID=A0A8D8X5D0_9HEMI
MEHFNLRLNSFQHVKENFNVSVISLANAGFYFSGVVDEVICVSCRIRVYQWTEKDNPEIEHKTHSPLCRFPSCCKESLNYSLNMIDFKNKLDKIFFLKKKIIENNPLNYFDENAKQILTETFDQVMEKINLKSNFFYIKHNHLIDFCELSDCRNHGKYYKLPCNCQELLKNVELINTQVGIYYHFMMKEREDYYDDI